MTHYRWLYFIYLFRRTETNKNMLTPDLYEYTAANDIQQIRRMSVPIWLYQAQYVYKVPDYEIHILLNSRHFFSII